MNFNLVFETHFVENIILIILKFHLHWIKVKMALWINVADICIVDTKLQKTKKREGEIRGSVVFR